ncbi:MAG: hypothetical protein B9S33_14395 [Pedosphaera sp. Tous-C6FEB]|nr:MAG: hypothetical protein B9S33_14395 [Pedosphaera sp. Tous-C6FEB]
MPRACLPVTLLAHMKLFLTAGLVLLAVAPVASGAFFGSPTAKDPAKLTYEKDVLPLLKKYCWDCHADGAKKASVEFDKYQSHAELLADRKLWEHTLLNVRNRDMPPPDKKTQPTLAEREVIQAWIDYEVFKTDPKKPDPGRVTLRRLNRAEYNNTIRDLVGVNFRPADDFPADDAGYGFDNIGDVLSMPPVLLEKYLTAAEKILAQAVITGAQPKLTWQRIAARHFHGGHDVGNLDAPGWVSGTRNVRASFSVAREGEYRLRLATQGRSAQAGQAKMGISLNGELLRHVEVRVRPDLPDIAEVPVRLRAGQHEVVLSYVDEHRLPPDLQGRTQARGFVVDWLEIVEATPNAVVRLLPNELLVSFNAKRIGSKWVGLSSFDEDDVAVDFHAPREGEYVLRTLAWAKKVDFPMPPEDAHFQRALRWAKEAATDAMVLTFMRDKEKLREVRITAVESAPQVYEVKLRLPAGKHRLSVATFRIKAGLSAEEATQFRAGKERRGMVFVHYLEIEGPPDSAAEQLAENHRRIFSRPATKETAPQVAREVIGAFARRAYRRPVTAVEVERLMKLYELGQKHGESFEGSVAQALKAVLVSPHFLFRGELQPEPDNPKAVHSVNEFSLASRLSYFLWSSMPDEELLKLAERGQLRNHLEAQVRRMLKDPKSRSLVENFAGQWLQLRNLAIVQPDKKLFPSYDAKLRAAMQRETELLFEHVVREDRSVFEFLTADYTFVNERLAKHYGLAGVTGDEFQRVSLKGQPRAGVLTHASILTLTSNPTRTSPVKRGKWVLENLLATPPPPPAPNVPELDDQKELTGTLRQRMEQHRANPNCASCHTKMDAIGFALENYDGIGGFRARDAGAAIDPSGELSATDKFNGPVELANLLARQKKDDFIRCLVEKLLTYSLGRGLEYYDRPATKDIADGLAKRRHTFSGLVLEVVNSVPFQKRRGEGDAHASVR